MDSSMLFQNWSDLGRTIVVGILAYLALVALLRVSGKRTLSKMNAFDLIVTVALGSTLATILLSEQVALAEGLLAFFVLIGMQFVITWSSVRSNRVSNLVKATPSLLFYDGEFLMEEMRNNRVIRDEVAAAIREQGQASIGSIKAVVLETDGSFSVITDGSTSDASTLDGLSGSEAVTSVENTGTFSN